MLERGRKKKEVSEYGARIFCNKKVKLQRAHGGYLGTQRRRRTWLPAICYGEPEADNDPEISEWGNPEYSSLNQ